ncbi:MAG: AMP-binding protein [Candidatus Puniceispirillaceae bacterium]
MPLRITLGALIHDCATRFADRPAITIAPSGETISYAELESRINRVGHGIRNLTERDPQMAASGHVAIMLENSFAYLAMAYALKKIDLVEVSINRAFRGLALVRMINLTECEMLLTSPAHFDALEAVADDLPHLRTLIVTEAADDAAARFPGLGIMLFDDLLADRDDHIESAARDTDTAVVMFTSGTTGFSKGCLLSHRYAVRTAENMIGPFRVTADDVSYTPYPLSHIGPAFYDILPTLMTGGRVVVRDGFSLSNFWPEMVRFGVTWFMCLGSVQQLLWSAPPCAEERQHRVTRCWATPAPVPKVDFDARFGLHLVPGGGYGSTDAGWVVVPQWDHPGGIVLPHYEGAIVDEQDDPVPAGCDGEMVIRPREPGVMADGYFGMPDKTLETRRNLWFHTGDIGRLDDQGRFYFRCRMAERIRVRGEMVSGFEVEEGALAHPQIEDAAAIGVPAALGEEDIRLFVTLKPGSGLTAAEIQAHCRNVMAKFMVPAIVTILDDMPRTVTGKPEKGRLAQMSLSQMSLDQKSLDQKSLTL